MIVVRKLFAILLLLFVCDVPRGNASNIFCYYDSRSYFNHGLGQMDFNHIIPALQYCTHLVYGAAILNHENYTIEPLNRHLDYALGNYRNVVGLKQRFPELKVLLSVGGDADNENLQKYEALLENAQHRTAFVSSVINTLNGYGFDGVDVAYQFPRLPPKVIKGFFKRIWHKVKTFFAGEKETIVDEHETQHRDQFTDLITHLKSSLSGYNHMLTVTVLPNVNSTAYFDVAAIKNYVDYVNLLAFDYQTADRVPKEFDYSASLYQLKGRRAHDNGNYWIDQLLKRGLPANKLSYGLPTYTRTWRLTTTNTVPPAKADGPGAPGPYTLQPGLLSRYETCDYTNATQMVDPTTQTDSYGYVLPSHDNNNVGIWISYDDRQSIYEKLDYVKRQELGGVLIYDLSLDDFRGTCSAGKYPFLRKVFSHMFR